MAEALADIDQDSSPSDCRPGAVIDGSARIEELALVAKLADEISSVDPAGVAPRSHRE